MIRTVVGVGLGFLLLSAVMVGGTEGALESLGADNVFRAGVYDTTLIWKAVLLVIGLAAGVGGGVVATMIGKRKSAIALAVVIGAIGVGEMLVYQALVGGAAGPRPETATIEMMVLNEQKPTWLLAGSTLMCAGGVLAGSVGARHAHRAIGQRVMAARSRCSHARCRFAHRKRATPGAPPVQIEA